jgi:hypothetical protein
MILSLQLLASLALAQGAQLPSETATSFSTFAWGDADGDGRLDAIVMEAGQPLRLLRQRADGGFDDCTMRAGLSDLQGVRQALWLDADGDKGLDLLLVSPFGATSLRLQAASGMYREAGARSGLQLDLPILHAQLLDIDGDGGQDLLLAHADRDRLWRQRGAGAWEEVQLDLAQRARGAGQGSQGLAAAAPPGAGVSSTPVGGMMAASSSLICAGTIIDSSNPNNCIAMSTIPTVGMLYPLSQDFNVDPLGNVGVGTLAPQARLDVAGAARVQGPLHLTSLTGAPLFVSSAAKVDNLNADLLDGVDASEFSRFGAGVDSSELEDGSVATIDLADGAVTGAKLALDAVGTAQVADGSITLAKLAPGVLNGSGLAHGSVGANEIADGAIGDLEIAAGAAIAGTKIFPQFGAQDVSTAGAVTGRQFFSTEATAAPFIVASSTTVTNLSADKLDGFDASEFSRFGQVVDAVELAVGAVGSPAIADGGVTALDLAEGAVGTQQLAAGSVTSAKIASGAIDSSKLGNGVIGAPHIADGAITNLDIAADAGISGSKIQAQFGSQDVQTAGKLSGSQLVSNATSGVAPIAVNSTTKVVNLNADSIDGFDSSEFSRLGQTIDSGEIQDGAVQGVDIGASQVGSAHLQANAVAAWQLQDGAVNSQKIEDGSISDADIAGWANISGAKISPNFGNRQVTTSGSITGGQLASNALQGTAPLVVQSTSKVERLNADLFDGFDSSEFSRLGANIDSSEILDGSVSGADLADRFVEAGSGFATIDAQATGNDGVAVRGHALAASGQAAGLEGRSDSAQGVGVRAQATSTTGVASALQAEAAAAQGHAVRATHSAAQGQATTILSTNSADMGTAVLGEALASGGWAVGVRGRTNSANGFGLFADGNLGVTGAKSFVQPHPEDPTKEIRFYCLEGNESGTYFRGTAKVVEGVARIAVPEDFRLASESHGLSVMLTAKGRAQIWYESVDLESVLVGADRDVEFSYVVQGVRRGYADMPTIAPNTSFRPTTRGEVYGTGLRPEVRRILVDNGLLNPDGTPNEAVAARLGARLQDPR